MKVKLLTPVQHDATSYAVGESAELPGASAKSLISAGAAEQLDPDAAKLEAAAAAELAEAAAAAALSEAEQANGKLV